MCVCVCVCVCVFIITWVDRAPPNQFLRFSQSWRRFSQVISTKKCLMRYNSLSVFFFFNFFYYYLSSYTWREKKSVPSKALQCVFKSWVQSGHWDYFRSYRWVLISLDLPFQNVSSVFPCSFSAYWSDSTTGNVLDTIIIIKKKSGKPTGQNLITHLRKQVSST